MQRSARTIRCYIFIWAERCASDGRPARGLARAPVFETNGPGVLVGLECASPSSPCAAFVSVAQVYGSGGDPNHSQFLHGEMSAVYGGAHSHAFLRWPCGFRLRLRWRHAALAVQDLYDY